MVFTTVLFMTCFIILINVITYGENYGGEGMPANAIWRLCCDFVH